jgi:3-dehydroquinate dehydratase/shikimate dehydrogenase
MAETLGDLAARRDAQLGVDLVELRLDALPSLDVDGVLAARRGRVIVTCRPTWEGGRYAGGEEPRIAALDRALALGADYIDVEWHASASQALCTQHGHRVVLSMHDFDGVPSDLGDRVRAMLSMGSAIVKVAVAPRSLRELVGAAQTIRDIGARNVAFIGMGASGFASRALPAKFGSLWSYCGDGVAPGQVPAERLVREFRFGRVTADAEVYAVVGRPIMHSLSPAMHNAAFDALGRDAVYVPLEAQSWEDFESLAQWLGMEGASVTAPFKQDAFRAVADMDAEARAVGAVNTLRRASPGRWQGRNSDVEGLLAPLAQESLQGARVAVLGAGGAARAACVALSRAGGEVTVHARRAESAQAVAAALGVASAPYPPQPGSWDILINATPLGTWPLVGESPVQASALGPGLVYDLVYNPERTQLLADAEAAGCRTLGGLEMLIAQAAAQCRWWTGAVPPTGVMAEAARQRLAERRDEEARSS